MARKWGQGSSGNYARENMKAQINSDGLQSISVSPKIGLVKTFETLMQEAW